MSKKAKQPEFKVGDKVKVQFTAAQIEYIQEEVGFIPEMDKMNGEVFTVCEIDDGDIGVGYDWNRRDTVFFPPNCLTHDIEDKPTKKETKPKTIKRWFLVDKTTGYVDEFSYNSRQLAREHCGEFYKVVKGYITLEE